MLVRRGVIYHLGAVLLKHRVKPVRIAYRTDKRHKIELGMVTLQLVLDIV